MSLLSSFAPFAAGGGINSIQTGYSYANAGGMSSGSTQDFQYVDITISSVTTSKAVPDAFGAITQSVGGSPAAYYTSGSVTTVVLPRLTSATNLRLSNNYGDYSGGIAARWYVVEAK
jgi:hypothetical protein